MPSSTHTPLSKRLFESKIEPFLPLIKRWAFYFFRRFPSSLPVDDLIQSGTIGALEAIEKYNHSKGASLSTYTSIRIRGAMLDEIRKNTWLPRVLSRYTRLIKKASQKIEQQFKRAARHREVAKVLKIDLSQYHQILWEAQNSVNSLDEVGDIDMNEVSPHHFKNGVFIEPHAQVAKEEVKNKIKNCMNQLPEKEKLVVRLYYDEELNLKTIGKMLHISESRVCQIHSRAVAHLQAKINKIKKR